jgi:hypothetical protein
VKAPRKRNVLSQAAIPRALGRCGTVAAVP